MKCGERKLYPAVTALGHEMSQVIIFDSNSLLKLQQLLRISNQLIIACCRQPLQYMLTGMKRCDGNKRRNGSIWECIHFYVIIFIDITTAVCFLLLILTQFTFPSLACVFFYIFMLCDTVTL